MIADNSYLLSEMKGGIDETKGKVEEVDQSVKQMGEKMSEMHGTVEKTYKQGEDLSGMLVKVMETVAKQEDSDSNSSKLQLRE